MRTLLLLAGLIPHALFAPDTGAGAATGGNAGAGEAEFKAAATALKGKFEEVSKLAETVLKDAKEGKETSVETKAAVDKTLAEFTKQMQEYDARITDTEQKAARRGGGGGEALELKTLGQHLADSDSFKPIREQKSEFRGNVRHSVETKALMTATTPGTTTSVSNSLIAADRRGIVNLPDRTLKVRDLIMPGSTASNSIEYPLEKLFDNQAAPVPEGQRKPESSILFDMTSTTVKTLAHIFKGSRQLLDDAPGLISYIDGRARYGLRFIEEAQILYGNGTGQNLKGIMPQATGYAAPSGVTVAMETPIDRIRLAILQATLSLYPATGIVLNDTDWARIELIKDTQGRHLIGNPQGQISPTLWGMPVATTLAMAVNDFLVGAFAIGAQLFDRMALEVLISTENEDDFVKNMITIRAEERLALAVYRPAAFVKGNLITAA